MDKSIATDWRNGMWRFAMKRCSVKSTRFQYFTETNSDTNPITSWQIVGIARNFTIFFRSFHSVQILPFPSSHINRLTSWVETHQCYSKIVIIWSSRKRSMQCTSWRRWVPIARYWSRDRKVKKAAFWPFRTLVQRIHKGSSEVWISMKVFFAGRRFLTENLQSVQFQNRVW
jgi:hypothetical protein